MTIPVTALSHRASDTFAAMWSHLEPIGRGDDGTYHRLAWTPVDLELRDWFRGELAARGLDVVEDRAGNTWGWWGGRPSADNPGLATGSHLDSVPGGGAFDGPLGVVAALAALDELIERGVTPGRPVGIVCFSDEEGGRFGVACLGSRVLTGAIAPADACALTDADGVSMGQALTLAGRDPARLAADPGLVASLAAFVEVHVEQGRQQVHTGDPLAVATHIWPHGRWHADHTGQGNHAGTTAIADRHDPTIELARFILAARESAVRHGAVATVGRVRVLPGGTNVIAKEATSWLDVRAETAEQVHAVLADLAPFEPVTESWSPATTFDPSLREALAASIARTLGATPPALGTGAGHDAGILSLAGVPSAMIFVRNPSGISHARGEEASPADCLLAVAALADYLEDWASGAATVPGPGR